MKRFILLGLSIVLIGILISTFLVSNQKKELQEKHLELQLRNIGHQLLLSAKDSSSLVLPIEKLSDNSYRISFQKSFGFISDSLINIIERDFNKSSMANNYLVSLKNCEQMKTVFAFEMNGSSENLTPCRGRKLITGCYFIEVIFMQPNRFNHLWRLFLFFPLGLLAYYFRKKCWPMETKKTIIGNTDFIQLGKFQFYPSQHLLKTENSQMVLSEQETKALLLFAQNRNQIVERELMMKEIWEKEGIVVISRNVDVLVSKLRKKLSEDSSIKLINVHGRGYKFLISEMALDN